MSFNRGNWDKVPEKRPLGELNHSNSLAKKPRSENINCQGQYPYAAVSTPPRAIRPQLNQNIQPRQESPYFRSQPRQQVAQPASASPAKPTKRRLSQCLLSGTVEKLLHWRSLRIHHTEIDVLFEISGHLDYVRNGSVPTQKIFMLRDADSGPVVKVEFYEIDRPLVELKAGEAVTVVGNLRGRSSLQAYKVTKIDQEQLNQLQHIAFICEISAKDIIKDQNLKLH